MIVKPKNIKSQQSEQCQWPQNRGCHAKHYAQYSGALSQSISSKEIGGWSWIHQSELIPLLIYVLPVFVDIENTHAKRQFDVGCMNYAYVEGNISRNQSNESYHSVGRPVQLRQKSLI
jgi:hypothetical protein